MYEAALDDATLLCLKFGLNLPSHKKGIKRAFPLLNGSAFSLLGGLEAWPQSNGLDSVLKKWKRSDWIQRAAN